MAMFRCWKSAAAEYGAEFRRDIESFVSIEAVRACLSPCVYERPKPALRILLRLFRRDGAGDRRTFFLPGGLAFGICRSKMTKMTLFVA
jgi:hypothetical protein